MQQFAIMKEFHAVYNDSKLVSGYRKRFIEARAHQFEVNLKNVRTNEKTRDINGRFEGGESSIFKRILP